MAHCSLVCLVSALLLFCGCGRNLGDRVVVEGKVSICSPAKWVVDKRKDDGATIIEGEGGRLIVVILDMPSTARDSESLMDTLKAMSPGISVIEQRNFSAGGNQGKEFIVSYLKEGRSRNGVVCLIERDRRLCVLTFTVRGDSLEEWLDVFRESAGTLRFLETSGDED